MKIAFVTTCLEPGRDGIGDYVMRLAGECLNQGHQVQVLALKDPHVTGRRNETRQLEGQDVTVARLEEKSLWPAEARPFLDNFNPDVVSFQFSGYGFSGTGRVKEFLPSLVSLFAGFKLAIMMHELWLGYYIEAPLKERFRGWLQRRDIMKMLHDLDPIVIHVSNDTYQTVLNSKGCPAKLLPLFSNIPVAQDPDFEWIYNQMQADSKIDISAKNRDDFLICGIFGAFHPVWPAEPLFSVLKEAAEKTDKKLLIFAVGKMGPGVHYWRKLRDSLYNGQFLFHRYPRASEYEASCYLSFLDIGLATIPRALAGKSGSITAMKAHGLPVIINRDGIHLSGNVQPPALGSLLHMLDNQLPEKLVQGLPKIIDKNPAGRRAKITQQFIADISAI